MGRNQGPEPLPFTLTFQAFHNPDKIALVDKGRRLTFRQLNLRVNLVASALADQGICRGDRVAVLLHNRAESIEVMFAMGRLKASGSPVGTRLSGPEIAFIVNNSDSLRATVAVSRPFDAEQFLATVAQERTTTSFCVPMQLNRIVNLPDAVKKQYDLSSMRALMTGAAPSHHTTKVKLIELFGPSSLYEFYGATETGINTILRPEDQLRKIGSCGRAVKGNDIRIIAEDAKEVAAGELGELYVKNNMLIRVTIRTRRPRAKVCSTVTSA